MSFYKKLMGVIIFLFLGINVICTLKIEKSMLGIIIFAVMLICTFPFSSCAREQRGTRDLLSDFLALYGAESGSIYASGAAEHSDEYLSRELADTLYLEENEENALFLCKEYAIYLSPSFSGGEIGFFRAKSYADATRVREMLQARMERLLYAEAVTSTAFLLTYGQDTVLVCLPEPELARKICDSLY